MSLIFLSTLHHYIGVTIPASTDIHGKVISFEESLSLKDATISVKGTTKVVKTQTDGRFTLSVQPGDKMLIVSLAEYQTTEISITSKSEYEIVLKRTISDAHLLKNDIYSPTSINATSNQCK
jgi:iron complex outermembrane receptor protein